jgi:iron complex outermembrane receptor protein
LFTVRHVAAGLAVWVLVTPQAFAQGAAAATSSEAGGDNAAARARDAFGERVGQEQVGLYNENQVRGFDLATTGAYRLEGRYILREFALPDVIIEGVSVRVGANAARLNYPSPSGVVDYRLRSVPAGANTFNIHTGIKENDQPFFELNGTYADEAGRFGIAGGAIATQTQFSNKTGGYSANFGAVPQWRPTDDLRIRGVFAYERAEYNGDFQYSTLGRPLPRKPKQINYGVPWADTKRTSINTGILVDAAPTPDWLLTATVYYADTLRSPFEFTNVALRPDNTTAQLTYVQTDRSHGRSLTGEATAQRTFETANTVHRLNAGLRGRQSRSLNISRVPVSIGVITLSAPLYPAEPVLPPALGALNSDVDQVIASAGYGGQFFDLVEFKLGVHHSTYKKTVTPPLGVTTSRTDRKILYDASLLISATETTLLFANAVRGVEESGTAPQNAINRFTVLPPVTAQEYELGVRQELTSALSLSVSGFDTTKLTAGLDPAGVFALVGKVRHRGAEVSLTGKVADDTSIVIGGMAMKPKLSGALVSAGLVSPRPVGVSSSLGFAGIDQKFSWAPNWAFDARMSWQAGRAADPTNTYGPKGFVMASVGARYNFLWGEQQGQLRLLTSNMFGGRPFIVGPSGLINQFGPATYRATLRLTY